MLNVARRRIDQNDERNDFLFAYLDAIDESLLDDLDDDGELKLDTVRRLRLCCAFRIAGQARSDPQARLTDVEELLSDAQAARRQRDEQDRRRG